MKLSSFVREPITWIAAGFAVVTAAGIMYDYGLVAVGDELPLLTTALKMIADMTLRPAYETFYHVALGVYAYLPVVGLLVAGLLAMFQSVAAVKEFVILDYALLLPFARLLTVLVGVGSLVLVYHIALKLFGSRSIAVYASLFTATSFLFTYISHFARIWPLQILTVLIAFYCILLVREEGRRYVLAGLSIGVAAGTHLIGSLIYVSFLASEWLRSGVRFVIDRSFWLANMAIAGVVALVWYLNPFGFLHYVAMIFPAFASVVPGAVETSIIERYEFHTTFGERITYYAQALFNYDPMLLVLGLVGLGLLFVQKNRSVWLLASFIAVYYVSVSFFGSDPRYISPLIPFLALSAAVALEYALRRVAPRVRAVVVTVVFAVLLIPAIAFTAWMLQDSTRRLALDWVYTQVSSGERLIVFDAYIPFNEDKATLADVQQYTDSFTIKRAYLAAGDPAALPAPHYYVLTVPYFVDGVPETLKEGAYAYALVVFWNTAERELERAELATFASATSPTLVATFGAPEGSVDLANAPFAPFPHLFTSRQSGPTIEVYRLQNP